MTTHLPRPSGLFLLFALTGCATVAACGSGGDGGQAAMGGGSGNGGGSGGMAGGQGGAGLGGGPGNPTTHAWKVVGAATWRDNASAAYSLIHDDVCDPSVNGVFKHADPLLVERGLHGGFGVIVSRCANRWSEVQALIAHGHEVFDHSWNHPCMTNDDVVAQACDPARMRSVDFATEIDMSTQVLREKTGVANQFFIFPYDACDPLAVARLAPLGYLGARCGDQKTQFNGSDFADPFKVQFDVWGPAYSHYGPGYPMTGSPVCTGVTAFETAPAMAPAACRTLVLKQYVDDTIARKGWAVREFHGFEDDGASVFEALPLADYTAHLDYLASKAAAHELWVEGPTEVIKYRFAREKCPVPTIANADLKFDVASADCRKYQTRVSYLIQTTDGSDPAQLMIRQSSQLLPSRKLGPGSFVVDANPIGGDARLSE
jgi:peptidoglycan/xylan/chitin deacetylase (PgdA/CDA1 family)